jgi:hypothetical protein
MIPVICPGDVLLVRKESRADIRRGHVILFRRAGRFFAHRVVHVKVAHRRDRGTLITRGDALAQEDAEVSDEELLGRVSAILRGRLRFELSPKPRLGERVLGWAFQRSDLLARSFLSWRMLRTRFAQQSNASASANREVATGNA